MDRAEKIMLILKAIFKDNEDLINKLDAIQQLKRPEILLSHEQTELFEEFAEEWHNKGWMIWTGKKSKKEEKIDVENDVKYIMEELDG